MVGAHRVKAQRVQNGRFEKKVLEGVIRDTGNVYTSVDKGVRGYFLRIVVCSHMNINS